RRHWLRFVRRDELHSLEERHLGAGARRPTLLERSALARDDREHTPAVADRTEVAGPVEATPFVRRNLHRLEPRVVHADVEQRLALEAVTPDRFGAVAGLQVEDREYPAPEGVVAVAQVRERGAMDERSQPVEHVITCRPEARDVRGPAARGKAAPLGIVSSAN